MSVVNISELKGTIQDFPFAELLAESAQAGFSGSFRLANQETKTIVYLNNGQVVFAVSNLRQHRFYQVLLQNHLIEKEKLAQIPNFTNDMELVEILTTENILSKQTADELLALQTLQIIKDILTWQTGTWSFSHLSKAKEGMQFQVDLTTTLVEYARNLSDEAVIARFKSFDEKFAINQNLSLSFNLSPLEGFIHSRLSESLVRIQSIKDQCGLSNAEILKTLYTLWLGNFVIRSNWNAAFSESQIKGILAAKLTLKKAASTVNLHSNEPEEEEVLELPVEEIADSEEKLLAKYLDRVETAESYYELLDVPVKATVSELKVAYFKLAKSFHPDRYHQEVDKELQQRVQDAFSEIARAYDTLKDEKARELYDFKLRKYLESIKDRKPSETTAPTEKTNNIAGNQEEIAKNEFDQGFDLLMNEKFEEATPFLARAIQIMPKNARYHAYYGKALSANANQRFKAEAEIREAMKLEADNVSYRLMLVEFYIQFGLMKRAEGELQRLLVQFPNNKEAQALLDTL